MIFTYVWAFDQEEDWQEVKRIQEIFTANGGEVFFVELEADLEERLKRNITPLRLQEKPTKRNLEYSEQELKDSLTKHRLNSKEGEIKKEDYMRINNSSLSATAVAEMIKENFNL